MKDRDESFSFLVTLAFTLNYIIGSGFLTIPWAIEKTGVTLGILCLTLAAFFSVASANFIVESMARADSESLAQTPSHLRLDAANYESISSQSMQSFQIGQENSDTFITSNNLIVGNNKFEIMELCELYMGITCERTYAVIISLYMYGTMWAYATVFSNAFSSIFNLGPATYWFCLLLFFTGVIPLSLRELNEQVVVQVALSICRVLMLICMIGTVIAASCQNAKAFSNISPSDAGVIEMTYNPKKLYILLPIAAYANIFHHSIPSLSQPVKEKSQLSAIFAAASLVCLVGYAAVGISVSMYFGSETLKNSNINWTKYVAWQDSDATSPTYVVVFAGIISKFVVLFPALDVASAFPLNAITLGNNLMSYWYGGPRIHEMEESRYLRDRFRLLAAVPPIVGAIFVREVDKITEYTGLTGFLIAFVFPPLLSICSERALTERGLSAKTVHSSWLTSPFMQYLTLAFGSTLFVYVFATLLMDLP